MSIVEDLEFFQASACAKTKTYTRGLETRSSHHNIDQMAWNRNLVGHDIEEPEHAWPYLLKVVRAPFIRVLETQTLV